MLQPRHLKRRCQTLDTFSKTELTGKGVQNATLIFEGDNIQEDVKIPKYFLRKLSQDFRVRSWHGSIKLLLVKYTYILIYKYKKV